MTDTGKTESNKTGRSSSGPVIETSLLTSGQEGPPAPRRKPDNLSGPDAPGTAGQAGTESVDQPAGAGAPLEAPGNIEGQTTSVESERFKKNEQAKNEQAKNEQTKNEQIQNGQVKNGQKSAVAAEPSLPDLSLVGSVPVTLTLNVGSKRMIISDILKLQQGSIVRFDRREHEPLDVRINGTLFARGEVVLLGDHYGLRILEIL